MLMRESDAGDLCRLLHRPPVRRGALDARGTIDGTEVPCLSAAMQLVAHEGYDLPATHRADVDRLRHLVGDRGGRWRRSRRP